MSLRRHFGALPCLMGWNGLWAERAFRASDSSAATSVRPQKTQICKGLQLLFWCRIAYQERLSRYWVLEALTVRKGAH